MERDSGGSGKTDLIRAAAGYAVFDPRGRRIGLVIELVDDPESGEQRLAIRRDGVILWHRRLLPLDAVDAVDAERRYVVVARNGEETARGLDEEERSVTLSAPAASDRYLRFVSTPNGYRLDEQDGETPAVGTPINGIDLPERLVVVKLGPSPLPHDPRTCAFLEREITVEASPGRSRA